MAITDSYFGGKGASGTYQKIINEIAPHEVFISPFLGRDKVIQNMKKADQVLGIDIDGAIIGEWKHHHWIKAEQKDGIAFLESFQVDKNKRVCLFLDPPYLIESRKSKRKVYRHELTEQDHRRILKAIKRIDTEFVNVQILICCYPHKLYETELKGWQLHDYESTTRKGKAIEWLFVNRPCNGQLHDYSYVGMNRTRRQQVKRKAQRWVDGLERLEAAERNAILLKLSEAYDFSGFDPM